MGNSRIDRGAPARRGIEQPAKLLGRGLEAGRGGGRGHALRPLGKDAQAGRRGHEVKEIYDRGELLSDDLIVRMIRDRLSRGDTIPGFILDGFPRNLAQAESLDALLEEVGRRLDVVFEFQIGDREVLMERIAIRAVEEGRTDDTPDAIRKRLEIYDRETAPLVEHYRAKHANVVGIHADQPVDDVFAEVREALEQVAARR